MTQMQDQALEQRVLVFASDAHDASLCDEVLRSIDACRHPCADLQNLREEIDRGAAAVIITEESLSDADLPVLREVLAAQPPWSDLPILVITEDRADRSAASEALTTLGNVVLLARPMRINTFISAMRTALRARQRQYETRQNLQEREADRVALALIAERFRTALKNAPVVVFNQDRDLRYTWIHNPYHFDKDRIIGKCDADVLERSEDAHRCESIKRRVLETGRGERTEMPLAFDGVETYWDLVVEPLRDVGSDEIVGVTCAALDITDHKRRERSMRFLAAATATLASSSDHRAALKRVADLAVRTIADWCMVDLREPDGSYKRIAVAHANPAHASLARVIGERSDPDYSEPHPFARVLRTGEPELLVQITDVFLQQRSRDDEQLELLRQVAPRSGILMPLVVRGEAVGLIAFAITESGRRYTQDDLAMVGELAADAAHAIETASLYENLETELAERKRAEAALRDSEERYRLAARATSDAIWDWNLADDTVEWSEKFGTLFGHELSKIAQTGNWRRGQIHPDDRARVVQSLQDAIDKDGVHWSEEYRFRCADGSYVNVLDRGFVVRDAEGRAVRMIGAMLDMTEHVRAAEALRASEERFRLAARATNDAIWDWDLTTDTVHWNENVTTLFGYGMDDVPRDGEAWDALIHPDDRRRVVESQWRTIENGAEHWSDEYRIKRADGTYASVLDRGFVVRAPDGRSLRMIGAMLDVSERKHAEEALLQSQQYLQRLNETLEQRVAERTAVAEQRAAQLRVLASELTSAEQRERRRLANILHDHLQQLLVAATMKIGVLRSRISNPQGKQMLQQIKELLSQSIATSRSLTVELSPPVLYDAGLPAALDWLARWMHEKHSIHVEVEAEETEPFGEDVRAFFFQAVRELLFNVVKHANTDRASVSMHTDAERRLIISVEDRGAGVDPEILRENRLISGEGFGLFNIRERLELLGGELRVESTPGEGTRITMIAPWDALVAPAADAADAGPRRSTTNGGRRHVRGPLEPHVIRVLVADDHQIVREGLMGLIQEHDDMVVVGEACDGQMAVELAAELKPDVVIMDVSMPQLNGIEATRQITGQNPQVRVIGLSMHDRDTMASAMRKAGAVMYLPKGGPSEPLIEAIRGSREFDGRESEGEPVEPEPAHTQHADAIGG